MTQVYPESRSLLIDYLSRPNYILTIFGFGRINEKRPLVLRIFYDIYSAAVVLLLALVFVRATTFIRFSGRMDLTDIAMILLALWGLQALFSSIFTIYHSRRPLRMDEIRNQWVTAGCDGLITFTNFDQVNKRGRYLLIFFAVLNVGWNATMLSLQFFDYLPLSWPPDFFFEKRWLFLILIPFNIYGVVAWMLPLYRYYVACTLFRYSWIGFCKKMQNVDSKDTTYGEALRYASWQQRQLSETMREINCFYGLYILVILTTSLPVIILQLYLFAARSADLSNGLQMGWRLFTSVVQVLLIFSSSWISDSANGMSESFYCYYERLNKQEIRASEHGQAHLSETAILLERLNNCNIAVSAWGLFDVSKSGLLALGSAILSYYVILIQFATSPTCNCVVTNQTCFRNDTITFE